MPEQGTPKPGSWINRVGELEEETEQLKEAVTSHAVVDQAIGMMIAMGRIDSDQGWTVLREISQHTNIKLRHVAELVLLWGRTGEISPEIADELGAALERHSPPQVPGSAPVSN
ncbi:ANTAR domain-containing protein [Streptomyces sp. NPDC093094]|uniref:ANTAR domain-containing protein n=1 Tax=Streptomyces sp. NPDC093094 TaxID=3366026 RepID=UPI0037FE5FA1